LNGLEAEDSDCFAPTIEAATAPNVSQALERSRLPMRITDRNKANYLAAKAAFNDRDLDLCLSYYAEDHQIMSRPMPKGREHIRAFLAGSQATWPDIQIVVEQAVAEGNQLMGRCVTTATHQKTVMGVAPTGKAIETTFWELHRFNDDGLICETWNLMDSLTIMQQLGLVPTG
jgi:steroid delta-isomerase-like uncharacterized protein